MELMEVQHQSIPENKTDRPYSLFFNFKRHEQEEWMEKNWTVSLYCVASYLILIYLGQEYMKNRKPFHLRYAMILWNFSLAAFSITACFTVVSELFHILSSPNGWYKSVCASCNEISDESLFLGWLFTLSKVVELGDTAFIILRKRRLIFLHWYHHITVLLFCWYSYSDQISPARWFVVVNYVIHSIMYTYYGLRAMKFWVPKPIAMSITALQLSQMVIGVSINVYAYRMKMQNVDCHVSVGNLQMSLGMYASYFFLFAHFFYKAYYVKGVKKNKIE